MRRFLLAAVAAGLAATGARAEIALAPLRQVITPQSPVAVYQVSNPSRRIVDGRIGWVDLVATETGYRPAAPEERSVRSAAPYLVFWPAAFRLEPGGRTLITVKLRDGATVPRGERRSHLLIETAAARTPLRRAGGRLEVDIDVGISTPVLLRAGPQRAAAHFEDTRLLRAADGLLELETHLAADSAMTPYGRVDIYMVESGESRPRRIAGLDNVAAYVDTPRRRVIVPLGTAALPAGIMEIRYVGGAEFAGAQFATRRFEIAPPAP
jgi:hypothetical protein